MDKYLGIDIGGSSIKTGVMDFSQGTSMEAFQVIPTPGKLSPSYYANMIREIDAAVGGSYAIGLGFPSVLFNGTITGSPDNMHSEWSGINLPDFLFPNKSEVHIINDADAAGIAEVYRPGAEALRKGTTIVLTMGTGIGSAVFVNATMSRNAELGLIELDGMQAENYAAPSIKTRENLSMKDWALRFTEYLTKLELYLAPDTIVIGGGISLEFEVFAAHLTTRAKLIPAHYRDKAGVVGACKYASLCQGAHLGG